MITRRDSILGGTRTPLVEDDRRDFALGGRGPTFTRDVFAKSLPPPRSPFPPREVPSPPAKRGWR